MADLVKTQRFYKAYLGSRKKSLSKATLIQRKKRFWPLTNQRSKRITNLKKKKKHFDNYKLLEHCDLVLASRAQIFDNLTPRLSCGCGKSYYYAKHNHCFKGHVNPKIHVFLVLCKKWRRERIWSLFCPIRLILGENRHFHLKFHCP